MIVIISKKKILLILVMIEKHASFREITRDIGVGKGTVTRYRGLWDELSNSYTLEDLERMSEKEVKELFSKFPHRDLSKALPDDWEPIYERVSRKKNHTNVFAEWRRFKSENPDSYQYTQFYFYFMEWTYENKGADKVSAILNRRAGEYIYVDWAGSTAELVKDEETGLLIKVYFFVTTIGMSDLIFVKAYPNMQEAAVIDGMNSAFKFYNGLPQKIKVDNMKTAIKENVPAEYRVELNRAFMDLERFYDTPVIPSPPRTPSDKSSVESTVGYISENLIAMIDGNVYSSFDELNKDIAVKVDSLNNSTREGKRKKSRQEVFEMEDKPLLRPLPYGKPEVYTYLDRKVAKNSHVTYLNHNYSVPYAYVGQEVLVKVGFDHLIICTKDNHEICRHQIATGSPDKYTTVPEHMPERINAIKARLEREQKDYERWARRIGPNMERFIHTIFETADYPVKMYRSCDGILHTCDHHPNSIGDNAAKQCIEKGIYSVKGFKAEFKEIKNRILPPRAEKKKSGTEQKDKDKDDNIRGGNYYK